jgi:hypothetical protein
LRPVSGQTRLVPSSGLATASSFDFGCFTWLVAMRLSIADLQPPKVD